MILEVVLRWTKKRTKKKFLKIKHKTKKIYLKKRSVVKKMKIQKNKIYNKTQKNLNLKEKNDVRRKSKMKKIKIKI